ncbi:MAG: glutamate-1-semialdehyde 2,1-aminomutase [Bdellovibrionales bacterium]|nr:glutamate-1-semialdehyde 2,1-aminomutase [Bdellovibrionales bacterium]
MINGDKLKKSAEYRKKVHSLIPGGAHTYSKGDDQFPEVSPAAISRGKGAYIWDLDENKYLDCSMGLTSVSLGHAYEPVVEAVKVELDLGVNFQRPSYIELEMAEKFVELIPGHDMVKFSKNGSTATTAAVKLARAYTNREKVAFPGDHPFYSYDDWFIRKTNCNKGTISAFDEISLTYDSTDLNSLERLFTDHPNEIACVISEPEKAQGIPKDYLQNLVNICHKHGALYIMDEMITGYKVDFPGSISKHGVIPDLATWGKGIANGFSFCALTGKKEVMNLGGILNEGAEKVFLISTTHGGETHAIRAALKTMEIFEKENVVEHLHKMGQLLIDSTLKILENKNLNNFIDVVPCKWWPNFAFKDDQLNLSPEFRTLFLQEMIKRGVLFQGSFVPCFSHQESDIQLFANAFEQSCNVFTQALEKKTVEGLLVGPAAKAVFRKYN